MLCITHLGLLGDRQSFGWPDRLTLIRALLPAVAPDSRWTAPLALATDFSDGRLARAGSGSAFGKFADPIADGVFWSWYALRWERNRWLRWLPITMFTLSVTGIAAAYFALGRTVDYPRPMAVRYASGAAQILFTMRSLRRAGP
jgi:phosphatidylglycerophosphate synthase